MKKSALVVFLATLVSSTGVAAAPGDADYVQERLAMDGYQVKGLELDLTLKPRQQFSHLFAPVADLAQAFNGDLVTMKYYDVHFETAEGLRYGCVAGVGNSDSIGPSSRYVEIKSCHVSIDDDGAFLRSKVVRLR